MVGVINSLTAVGLPLAEVTVADELQRAGYATLALGKARPRHPNAILARALL
jgi:arylsulfatase A-like enzyme